MYSETFTERQSRKKKFTKQNTSTIATDSRPAFTCSKLAIEPVEQGVKYLELHNLF